MIKKNNMIIKIYEYNNCYDTYNKLETGDIISIMDSILKPSVKFMLVLKEGYKLIKLELTSNCGYILAHGPKNFHGEYSTTNTSYGMYKCIYVKNITEEDYYKILDSNE